MEIKMLRGMSPEDCEFFRRELAAEISKIRAEYDVDNDNNRTEKESEYWSMVEELQKLSIEELNEQERERIEINNLDAELHALRKEKGELNIQVRSGDFAISQHIASSLAEVAAGGRMDRTEKYYRGP
jgi:ribosomal protein L29